MRARLVGGDLAGVDEFLDVGVVARDADEGALVEQVCARVAGVRDGHGGALDVGGGGGAAHARAAHAVDGRLDDGRVGRLDGSGEQGGVGRVGSGRRDGLDGDRARDLARGVAAHAVADGE